VEGLDLWEAIKVVHLHLVTNEDAIENNAITVTQVDTSVKSYLFIYCSILK
jgi:hypothetical protein